MCVWCVYGIHYQENVTLTIPKLAVYVKMCNINIHISCRWMCVRITSNNSHLCANTCCQLIKRQSQWVMLNLLNVYLKYNAKYRYISIERAIWCDCFLYVVRTILTQIVMYTLLWLWWCAKMTPSQLFDEQDWFFLIFWKARFLYFLN